MNTRSSREKGKIMTGSLVGLFVSLSAVGGVLSWNTFQGLYLAIGTTAEVLFENGRLVWGAFWMAGNLLG